jgi:hypothetical protein
MWMINHFCVSLLQQYLVIFPHLLNYHAHQISNYHARFEEKARLNIYFFSVVVVASNIVVYEIGFLMSVYL